MSDKTYDELRLELIKIIKGSTNRHIVFEGPTRSELQLADEIRRLRLELKANPAKSSCHTTHRFPEGRAEFDRKFAEGIKELEEIHAEDLARRNTSAATASSSFSSAAHDQTQRNIGYAEALADSKRSDSFSAGWNQAIEAAVAELDKDLGFTHSFPTCWGGHYFAVKGLKR